MLRLKKFVMDFLSSTEAGVLVVSHNILLMDSSLPCFGSGKWTVKQYSRTQYLKARDVREEMRARQAAVVSKEIEAF